MVHALLLILAFTILGQSVSAFGWKHFAPAANASLKKHTPCTENVQVSEVVYSLHVGNLI